MNRTDRLIAMVLLLHGRKLIRAKDIAEHFGIALRTVYRDMKALNEAGVPISAESGEGYSLVAGYHLPPVMFTKEEAVALYLGTELTRKLTDSSLTPQTDSALLKILSILPEEKRNHLEKLKSSTYINTRQTKPREGFRDGTLALIQNALVMEHTLSMEYFSIHRDSFTDRKVDPLGLVFYSNNWHLIGYCHLRKDIRDFRTDRIRRIFNTEEKFVPTKDFSLKEYLENDREARNAEPVKIKFDATIAGYVRDRNWYGIVEEQKIKDGTILTFMIPLSEFFIHWLLSFGEHIEIITPDTLRKEMHKKALQLVQHFS